MSNLDTKVPPNLTFTTVLSSSITIVVSIVYIVLTSITLAYRYDCDAADSEKLMANQLFWATIYKIYIRAETCGLQVIDAPVDDLTQPYTVFVFTCLTLSFSVLTLLTACILIIQMFNKDARPYVNVYVYAYIGSWVGSLVVDVTLATHVGMDYTFMTKQLMGFQIHYEWDMIRQGAMYLMIMSMKGFVVHAINLALIICMVVYLYDYRDMTQQEEHAIHKVGAINAFDQPRRNEDNLSQPDNMYYGRGMPNNYPEEPRNLNRNDYYNNARGPGSFRRSESWNQSPPQPAPQPSTSGSRPFSYLEDPRRPTPTKPSALAAHEWRGAWPPPPVPAPDYSPHSPRRLKSALKPNYM